jgi:hypothetical protein
MLLYKKIRSELIKARMRRQELRAELMRVERLVNDLEAAERVFQKFSEEPNKSIESVSEEDLLADFDSDLASSRKKPDNLPTIPEMIDQTLAEAEKDEVNALRPTEVLKYIRDRWWPEAKASDVGPVMVRLANNGRLINRDGQYSRAR